jgi:hypothetical protein
LAPEEANYTSREIVGISMSFIKVSKLDVFKMKKALLRHGTYRCHDKIPGACTIKLFTAVIVAVS